MAEMQQLVNEQKERPAQPVKADLNEEEDNVADFIEASHDCLTELCLLCNL